MKKVPFNVLAHAGAIPAGVLCAPRADAGNVVKLISDVEAKISGMRDDLMRNAETALAEAKKSGTLSAEVKASVDEGMAKWNQAHAEAIRLQGVLEGLEARTLDMEQMLAGGGGTQAGAPKTAGAELVESDALKSYVAGGLSGDMRFAPNAAITTADGSGSAWSEREGDVVQMPRRRLLMRNLLNVSPTGAGVIDYMKQTTRTNNAGMTAEGGTMPTSDYGWTKAQAIVRKISHKAELSDEAFADAPRVQNFVDTEMRFGLDLKEDVQILTGDGTGENLSGLQTEATAFSAASGLPDGNRIERLRLAFLQVVLADYAADGAVLNPTDWAAIELTKDANGVFVVGSATAPAGPRLWSVPVVETPAQSAGSWLAGAFAMAATLYDRQQTELLISSENKDYFESGMKTVRATKRVALEVKRGASLVTGDFTF